MIDKLRVRNFRCLRDVEVPLGPLNFLIGPNNTGKSSLLDAAELLWRCIDSDVVPLAFHHSGFRFDRIVTGGDAAQHIQYDTELSFEDEGGTPGRAVHALSLCELEGRPEIAHEHFLVEGGEAAAEWESSGRESRNQVRTTLGNVTYRPHITILHQLLSAGEAAYSRPIGSLRCAPKFSLIPARIAAPCEIQPSLSLGADGFGLAACLDLLREQEPDRFAEIENALRGFVDTVQKVTFPTVEPGKKAIVFHEQPSGYRIPASEASDGLLLFLAYLTIAYAHGDASVLLFEEPETGVHPHRLKAIVELLRAISRGALGGRPVQVVATSHSPFLLDWCGKEEIIVFLRDEEGEVRTKPLSEVPDIDEQLKDFSPGELIYTFGERICESRS